MEEKKGYLSDKSKEYLSNFIEIGKYKSRTHTSYLTSVRALCNFAKKDFLELTDGDIVSFVKHMKSQLQHGELTQSTFNVRVTSYKTLAEFIYNNYPGEMQKLFTSVPLYPGDEKIKSSKIPSLEEMDKLLSTCAKNPMHYLIVALAFRVGFSTGDIVGLTLSSVHTDAVDADALFITFKSRKERIVRLPEDVSKLLKNYIDNMGYVDDEGHLFYNSYGNPMTARNLVSLINKLLEKSGLPTDYCVRDFRSRAILDMVEANVGNAENMEKLQDYVNLKGRRMYSYIEARHLTATFSPADYVNIRVGQVEEENS